LNIFGRCSRQWSLAILPQRPRFILPASLYFIIPLANVFFNLLRLLPAAVSHDSLPLFNQARIDTAFRIETGLRRESADQITDAERPLVAQHLKVKLQTVKDPKEH